MTTRRKPPAAQPEEIIIHGLWQTDHRFQATGRTLADAIPNAPSLLAMAPGVIVPGKPLRQFAAIHKDDVLTFTFPADPDNPANEATIETSRNGEYSARMRLRPTPAELDNIGFTALIYANLGNR